MLSLLSLVLTARWCYCEYNDRSLLLVTFFCYFSLIQLSSLAHRIFSHLQASFWARTADSISFSHSFIMLSSIFLSLALFGASTLGQVASSTTGTATKTASGKSSVTSGGISTNGPLAVAENACFPRAFASAITDTPCFSMEVLNRACFYGPSVLETATATPSVSASPKQQQQCYCDPVNGAGYMYFEFMQGYPSFSLIS